MHLHFGKDVCDFCMFITSTFDLYCLTRQGISFYSKATLNHESYTQ